MKSSMRRKEFIDLILDSISDYFDIYHNYWFENHKFVIYAYCYNRHNKYESATQESRLWEMKSFEHLFFINSDNLDMDDASDYVYEFILCSICPVKLDKPGLCYNVSHNTIENRVQDWVVGAPENGFLFPAFTDRNTDIHNLLYFTKNAEMDQPDFLDHFLGCQAPLSAKSQKETFQSIIEETLDSACDFSTVMTIQENLNTMIEERKDDPEPVVLDKHEVKRLLASSGVPNEQLDEFDEKYESIADEKASFVASNVASTRNYEIRTPDVIIKVSPEKAQLIETRTICLLYTSPSPRDRG